jgi:hypothetical protein
VGVRTPSRSKRTASKRSGLIGLALTTQHL